MTSISLDLWSYFSKAIQRHEVSYINIPMAGSNGWYKQGKGISQMLKINVVSDHLLIWRRTRPG